MWTAGTDRPLKDMTAKMAYVVKFQNNERTDCLKHKGRRSLGIDINMFLGLYTLMNHAQVYIPMPANTHRKYDSTKYKLKYI